MSDRRYTVHAIAWDSKGMTDGDYDDFERALTNLLAEWGDNAHLLGTDWTRTWPTYRVSESNPERARSVREGKP